MPFETESEANSEVAIETTIESESEAARGNAAEAERG